jgi:hypothetical protein
LAALLGTSVSAPEGKAESMSENRSNSFVLAVDDRLEDREEMRSPGQSGESHQSNMVAYQLGQLGTPAEVGARHVDEVRSPAAIELFDVVAIEAIQAFPAIKRVIN